MKKILKTFFLFLFFFFALTIGNYVKANSIDKISMEIYVDNSGNAHITETWNCTATKDTEFYHSYGNLGNSEIYNFSVYEGTTMFQTLNSWDISASFSDKAYKCGINETSDGVELCWGISEYGRHSYTLNYTISNFVVSLSDCQMIYWQLIPSTSLNINYAYIKIYADFDISDTTDVWGYGNYGGTCYVYDGYIEMQSDNALDSDEYMTILVKFPLNTFSSSLVLDNNFEHYFEMAEDGAISYTDETSLADKLIGIFSFFITFFIIAFSLLAAKFSGEKFNFGPEGKKFKKDSPYFRDIPCEGNIFRAYYIAYEYKIIDKKTDLLGAIILKWLKDSIIRIDQKESGKIFKKENTVIVLNETNPDVIKNKFENRLFKMLFEASKDGILENKEFEKWCNTSYSKILSWFDSILKQEKNDLVSDNIITYEEKKTLGIFKSKNYTATSELRRLAEEIYGLKHFLLDYSLIDEREAIEVHLFEEYLVYAQMFGIAKKVAKQFKDLYPEIIEQSSYNSYDNIIFIHTCSSNAVSSANSAKARAESYSAGGGGFSSGGGGFGSFGGGGSIGSR